MLFRATICLALLGFGACSESDSRADARPRADAHITDYSCNGVPIPEVVPDTITVSGKVYIPGIPGVSPDEPVAGVLLRGFEVGSTSHVSQTISREDGTFDLVTETEGRTADTFVQATKNGLLQTRLFSPRPLTQDVTDIEIPIVDESTRDLLIGRSGVEADTSQALVLVGVVDCAFVPVKGAVVTTTPAAGATVYQDSAGIPTLAVTETSYDGFAFLFNVPSDLVEVTAKADGVDFRPVQVPARPISNNIMFAVGVGP